MNVPIGDDPPALPSGRIFPDNTKILIVEDENIVAWDVEELLRDHGVRDVLSAPTLKRARELLALHPDISLVLLDLKLEDGCGAELIDELTGRGIPIVITTGYPYQSDRRFPVISKPYTSSLFLETILDAIAK